MDATDGTVSIIRLSLQIFVLIQHARGFEDEFERYQLYLQVQLANCSSLIHEMAGAGDSSATYTILCGIRDVLRKAQQEAAKVKADFTRTGLPLLEPNTSTTTLNLKILQVRMAGFLGKRKVQAVKAIEGLKWIVYKRAMRDKFIQDISVLMQDLERQVGREGLALRDTRIMDMMEQWHQYHNST
ncbi:hypothetical protein TrVFT333_000887 [Trichoderma virens FT-333]|nr:hypothetical protein TrVFT333_000887 [Trichoderma virens FT-333]